LRQNVGGDSDRRTVVFLDRDGVINRNLDGDYVKSIEEFEFLPGALEGLARLKRAGCTAVIISNQQGVGKGLMSAQDLDLIDEAMLRSISEHGGEIAAVRYCIHRKEENCSCRKPQTGLFTSAAQELGISLDGAYFVGDSLADLQAGVNAGCRTVIVLTGRTSAAEIETWERKPDRVAEDLPAAVEWILRQ
jgi:D-glycero-D-manno-heptose 1,7-bisphosphate phosphatase